MEIFIYSFCLNIFATNTKVVFQKRSEIEEMDPRKKQNKSSKKEDLWEEENYEDEEEYDDEDWEDDDEDYEFEDDDDF